MRFVWQFGFILRRLKLGLAIWFQGTQNGSLSKIAGHCQKLWLIVLLFLTKYDRTSPYVRGQSWNLVWQFGFIQWVQKWVNLSGNSKLQVKVKSCGSLCYLFLTKYDRTSPYFTLQGWNLVWQFDFMQGTQKWVIVKNCRSLSKVVVHCAIYF